MTDGKGSLFLLLFYMSTCFQANLLCLGDVLVGTGIASEVGDGGVLGILGVDRACEDPRYVRKGSVVDCADDPN